MVSASRNDKKILGVSLVLIVALASLVLSLLLILLLHNFDASIAGTLVEGKIKLPAKPISFIIGEHIATALFILGVWHSIEWLFLRREFNSEVISELVATKNSIISEIEINNQRISLLLHDLQGTVDESLTELERQIATANHDQLFGLIGTDGNANTYEMADEIRSSQNLTAVMADGQAWVSRHMDAFRQRLQVPHMTTTVILVHPESDQLDVISRKNGMSRELYKQRILWTVGQLKNIASREHNLIVRGHSLVSCHAVFITDSKVIFTPYFLSTQRRASPVLIVQDSGEEDCFYRRMKDDVKFLEKESVAIEINLDSESLAFRAAPIRQERLGI
jgi:hypothetical protein